MVSLLAMEKQINILMGESTKNIIPISLKNMKDFIQNDMKNNRNSLKLINYDRMNMIITVEVLRMDIKPFENYMYHKTKII